MTNYQNSLFSNKGFYLGVAIFIFGLALMITRVVMEVSTYTKAEPTQEVSANDSISQNIQKLQNQLDQKIQEQEVVNTDFQESIKQGDLKIFEHNPVSNYKGIITVVEFIDYGCPTCLVDANFANRILQDNESVKLVSKLTNLDADKQLHVANIASLVAADKDKYFEFRNKVLTSTKSDLNAIIDNLENSGVSLREFRQALTNNSNELLTYLSQDIKQSENLKVKGYTVFINNRMFSDAAESKYKLKDITVYLNNI
jgi:protein-disulfide isomerase